MNASLIDTKWCTQLKRGVDREPRNNVGILLGVGSIDAELSPSGGADKATTLHNNGATNVDIWDVVAEVLPICSTDKVAILLNRGTIGVLLLEETPAGEVARYHIVDAKSWQKPSHQSREELQELD